MAQVVDGVNAQGGVTGRKLDLEVLDDGSDANQTVVQFNKLLDESSVAVDWYAANDGQPCHQGLAAERKIPTIGLAAGDQRVCPQRPR